MESSVNQILLHIYRIAKRIFSIESIEVIQNDKRELHEQ